MSQELQTLTEPPPPADRAPHAINGHPPSAPAPSLAARALAFYLPQFHPIPENDQWWGKGFTEWTNVTRAKKLFHFHNQPHLPADLGFYDLRCAESRLHQAQLAQSYGIEAFCYWHYWFGNGRRVLERPFDEVLASGQPSQKFCLAWANHSWSGIWDGAPDRLMIEQTYPGPDDDRAHFDHLLPAFTDPRYLLVDGKPLFYIFRPEQVPDIAAVCDRWRKMAAAAGLKGLYLVAEISDLWGRGPTLTDPEKLGFDAAAYVRLPIRITPWSRRGMVFRRRYLRWPETWDYATQPIPRPQNFQRDSIHPCIYPNWDNTPRSGRRGLVVRNASPERFRIHARHAIASLAHRPADRRLLFIKSWNEWAEGNYLEPDREFGHGNLKVLHEELTAPTRAATPTLPLNHLTT